MPEKYNSQRTKILKGTAKCMVDKIFSLITGKPHGIECILVLNIYCTFSRTALKSKQE
jgi:hypothetical protein